MKLPKIKITLLELIILVAIAITTMVGLKIIATNLVSVWSMPLKDVPFSVFFIFIFWCAVISR